MRNILAINPWIHDFAAYDYWTKPYGFLQILEYFKKYNFNIKFVDLLDRYHPLVKEKYFKEKKYGTGKFYSEEIKKPKVINWVPRKYKRYGLPKENFKQTVNNYSPNMIMITSSMTYWYPGVFETIQLCKKQFPSIPVILGGTYATLCYEHAKRFSKADYVVSFRNLSNLSNIVKKITDIDIEFDNKELINITPSYFQYYNSLPYAVIRTSWGCSFNCSYCASHYLSPPKRIIVDCDKMIPKLQDLNTQGIKNFVFYDDALLVNKNHIQELLNQIIHSKMEAKFHTPNGLHARFLSYNIAELFKEVNFINPRVSLETTDNTIPHFNNAKVNLSQIEKAISNLKKAGYKKGEYSVYLLLGIPGENLDLLEKTLSLIHKLGAHIYLTEFSPIPKTELWDNINFNKEEPLLQNNSLFPFYNVKEWNKLQRVKDLTQVLNNKL